MQNSNINADRQYRIIRKECGLEKEPHILISILSQIPPKWANNFNTTDIITLVNMLKKYRQDKRILS